MKNSFTLIEILLSLMILSILFLAMNGVIKGVKVSEKRLNSYFDSSKNEEVLIKTLYLDIINSTSIKIIHSKNIDYDRIYLITSNSLYNLIYPNVLWYVSKKQNSLIRVESPKKIVLPSDNLFFLDKFKSNVKLFKIYKKGGKDLVILKAKKALYFEILDKDLKIKSQ